MWNRLRKSRFFRALILLNCSLFFILLTACNIGDDPAWGHVDDILRNIESPEIPDRDYDITAFGAVSDTTIDSRESIMKAINSCNAEGGGRVIIPGGTFLSNGPIHLKSNVHLFLARGARLEFGTNVKDYLPVVLTRFEGTELFGYSPFIYAYQATDIAITGSGIIDGNARRSFVPWKHLQTDDKNILRQMGNDCVPVNERVMGEGHYIRPSMLQLYGCKNVLIEGITLVDSPFWVIHPVFCEDVVVRGVTVDSWNYNNDGVDPDGCENVLIEDCTFNCGDDAVAIKAGRDQDGWRVGQATENVVIRNCDMNSRTNGLCIGSEMSAGVRNIFMENCRVGEAHSTIYFKANLDRGGVIENVYVRDITVKRAKTAFIRFESNYKGHRGNYYPTQFKNFTIEDITCEEADQYGVYAVGIEGTPIRNVTIRDVDVQSAKVPTFALFLSDFQLVDVEMNDSLITKLQDTPQETENLTW
ncbi:glycoside hydrolase family 28 protein [candidate division KSB1 bacterium]|nr:glycoside hydrolase family 28 protein [candidate division KSB1 bacterium]